MTHTPSNDNGSAHPSPNATARRLLITAGPTWEPIDAVRYLGNRSSGRVGVELAGAARKAGWNTRLLLGVGASFDPSHLAQGVSPVDVRRFQTTADLAEALDESIAWCDVLVMAAAVADYRPIVDLDNLHDKIRRTPGRLTIECEPTPDLLADVSKRKRADQLFVGFALEPTEQLVDSARRKLERKGVDLVVANPLDTMDSDTIQATIVARDGLGLPPTEPLPAAPKSEFGHVLMQTLDRARLGVNA